MSQNTAAILIIGDEILSGRVKDENLHFLALELGKLGIKLIKAIFIADDEAEIISNIQKLKIEVDYLILTGGIGPTHDDITCESVAKAFDVKYELNNEAYKILYDYYSNLGKAFLEGAKKMAYIPKGSQLLYNKLTTAPGFKIGNVFVFPGIPSAMQQMFNDNKHFFAANSPFKWMSVKTNIPESKFAFELGELQKKYSTLSFGSYPKLNQDNTWETEVVVTSNNPELLAEGFKDLKNLIQNLEG